MIRFSSFVLLLLVGVVSAGSIGSFCVDLDAPSAPGNLSVSGEVGSILVEWDASVDEPSCSGVDYYVVLRGNETLGETGNLSFVDVDDLDEGNYTYYVYAVDLVGGNAGASVVNEVEVSNGYVSRGGGGSNSWSCSPNWVCGNWSDCLGGDMRRVCEDTHSCGSDYLKPDTYMSCGDEEEEEDEVVLNMEDVDVEDEDGVISEFFSSMTGAVIGGGTGSVASAGVLLLLSVSGLFFVVRRKRKKLS